MKLGCETRQYEPGTLLSTFFPALIFEHMTIPEHISVLRLVYCCHAILYRPILEDVSS